MMRFLLAWRASSARVPVHGMSKLTRAPNHRLVFACPVCPPPAAPTDRIAPPSHTSRQRTKRRSRRVQVRKYGHGDPSVRCDAGCGSSYRLREWPMNQVTSTQNSGGQFEAASPRAYSKRCPETSHLVLLLAGASWRTSEAGRRHHPCRDGVDSPPIGHTRKLAVEPPKDLSEQGMTNSTAGKGRDAPRPSVSAKTRRST
jgi:hypothetical protein